MATGGSEVGVVRVRDDVDLCGRQLSLFEAPPGAFDRKFPRRERHRLLGVLTPSEALLFGRGNDVTVYDECRRRVVEHGVDTKHGCHRRLPPQYRTRVVTSRSYPRFSDANQKSETRIATRANR